MEMELSVLVPQHEERPADLTSPMGGKHQRSLSLSAKWASDKSMALEYLHRQHNVLQRELPTTDLFEALKSGVVLRETVPMETLFPDISNCMSPISRNYTKRMAPWKERENISVFLRQCKSYVFPIYLADLVEMLINGHFMLFSEEHAAHDFKPVDKSQPAEFSNQEVRNVPLRLVLIEFSAVKIMALSKIEMAGVDAKALKGLMAGSNPTLSPEKSTAKVKATTIDEEKVVKSITPSDNEEQEANEPAENDKSTEQQLELELKTEVCNQILEDKDCEEVPELDATATPEQESGSDADDGEDAVEPENTPTVAEEQFVVEATAIDTPIVEDEATVTVIAQILSDMAAAIEEAEREEHWKALAMATPPSPVADDEPRVDIDAPSEAEVTIAEIAVAHTDVEVETKGKVPEEIKAEATAPDATDRPAEAADTKEDASIQPAMTTSRQAVKRPHAKNPEPTDEELDAKAMSKCTCGKNCTIM
ncbi:hypothetical protein BBJ28_00003421 [Nothophytophthora sp. Chile5]|nr:hypothetical protein BBJ28_00003421 [Nothophytophthora sp. Chile5]